MSVIELAGEDLDREAARPGVLVVAWWAPLAPASELSHRVIVTAAAAAGHAARFAEVNVSEHLATARDWNVHVVPAVMVFRDGLLVYAGAGPASTAEVEHLVDGALALDMDEVRRARNGHPKGTPILPPSWIERAAERVYEAPRRR